MLFYECEPSSFRLEDCALSTSSSVANRSLPRHVDADATLRTDNDSDSDDYELSEDDGDEEDALDVFEGLSKVMRIRTLALAAGSEVS